MKIRCAICNSEAITTAAHIPVCEYHWHEYADEGEKYLPDHARPVLQKLIIAHESPNADLRQDAVGDASQPKETTNEK